MLEKRSYRYLDRAIRPVLYAGLVCLAVAAMRWGEVDALGHRHYRESITLDWFWSGVVAVAFFLLCWGFLYWRGRAKEDERTRPEVHGERVFDVSNADAVSTLLLVAATSRYFIRANETISVEDGYYRHSVVTEWSLPTSRDLALPGVGPGHEGDGGGNGIELAGTYLLPIVRIARPRVVDNLVIEAADGSRLSACNSEEFAGVVKQIVTSWVRALTGGAITTPVCNAIEALAVSANFDVVEPPAEEEITANDLIAAIQSLARPELWVDHADTWDSWRKRLERFCRAVVDGYIVFVPVTAAPGERVVLSHSFTRRHSPTKRTVRDRLRYWLGLRPHTHGLTIRDHIYAQSYHLEFQAPSEQYVYDCTVRSYGRGTRSESNCVVAPVGGAGGRDYAHVYVRPAEVPARSTRSQLRVIVDCREKPPGLLGLVTLVAFAQAVLIWTIGKFYSHYFPLAALPGHAVSGQGEPLTPTDVPALLLALPGLAAAWLGSQFTGERLRSTSLSTVVGIFVLGALAVASTAAAVVRGAGSLIGAHFGVAHPAWMVLMVASAVLALDLSVRTVTRIKRFSRQITAHQEPMTFLV